MGKLNKADSENNVQVSYRVLRLIINELDAGQKVEVRYRKNQLSMAHQAIDRQRGAITKVLRMLEQFDPENLVYAYMNRMTREERENGTD